MRQGSCSEEGCFTLLKLFEHVLESDPLILSEFSDEVGFIHPSQFNMLDEEAGSSSVYQNEHQPNNETSRKFWNQDHKLGISTDILVQLCKDAKHVFLLAFEEYKRHGNACNESQIENFSCSPGTPEIEVMRHSQAVLLLSSDFGTAWNARKLILSKKDQLSAFTEELRLAGLILSNSPKSESTWSHRRWIIKMISQRFSTPQVIITKESELVESIGERSKMNYRAWYHRCWLVSYMAIEQRLMLKILESLYVKGGNAYDKSEARKIWKEELDWNKELVERYVGREALWLHRRFLSLNWIIYFACNDSDVSPEPGESIIMNEEIAIFIDNEIHLLESSMIVPDTKFEDFQAQALHAGVYMLWLTKKMPELWRMVEEKLGTEKVKCVLSTIAQERPSLLHHLVNV
ncbi:uncharacterized protein LOC9329817 isoform X3 [Arabidopsis lyrata subsp. lyrata]|uniref:uncharacterized protein LOC9329817 isoform X3 n=1 Tax=Arabidopsis lyrata subsp. lyrata TaxID=81972 RepID=UPI000A29CF52|nr:uncharacterized protein LOC9329817 isoform X3 [Arabidopsis lyrata subsp. lyrata]|eukprot:XP_020867091.1 uncharacterized protein LOC9329817 isoform X3 [Arabidopsis lyrata subsp. lyrata]